MPILTLSDLPERGPLLGLDPGSKTIGLAACDAGRLIASPVETLAKGRKLAPVLEKLLAIYDERGAVGMVIGLPLNMDGSEGPRAQSARALAHNILRARDLPIALFDERLSSAQAERAMLEADLSRARRAELIDASAAAVILQAAIDQLANQD
ncbi:MAG: Holliday junction resolvase RuvX [Pseudomonadota bacterium]